jgi:ATP-dependent DNA ligase
VSAVIFIYCDHIEERGEDLFRLACDVDLEGIVAKPKNSPYRFTENQTCWLKLKNPNYSQSLGRDDLFAPAGKKPPQPDWVGCALACAEAEL